MSIGNFIFLDEGKGKVFIQNAGDGEGGIFNWSNVPSVVKAVILWREIGIDYPSKKDSEAIEAMNWFWEKHF